MGFAVDQHPVCALGPDGPHPAFGITIRPRCALGGDFTTPHALAGQDIIERAGELGVAVPDEEPQRADQLKTI